MPEIELSSNAERRIEERHIAIEAVIDTILNPSYKLYDVKEDTLIYTSEKHRLVVAAVRCPGDRLYIVTAIPVGILKALCLGGLGVAGGYRLTEELVEDQDN